jgi:hypothetical protein
MNAAATANQTTPSRKPVPVVPSKVGVFGAQGAGKTTSAAAMLALGLAKELARAIFPTANWKVPFSGYEGICACQVVNPRSGLTL